VNRLGLRVEKRTPAPGCLRGVKPLQRGSLRRGGVCDANEASGGLDADRQARTKNRVGNSGFEGCSLECRAALGNLRALDVQRTGIQYEFPAIRTVRFDTENDGSRNGTLVKEDFEVKFGVPNKGVFGFSI